MQVVLLDGWRDHDVPVLRVIHERVCSCESYESGAQCVCAFTHEVQSLPEKEEEGDLVFCTYVLNKCHI